MTANKPTGAPVSTGKRRVRNGTAPTIYDVAELAGVNPSTVSRAFTKPGRVSAATEAKIRAAASELNFQFNPVARALHSGRTKTLALIVADITNPTVFALVRGAEKAAAAAGYTLVIAESQESGIVEASTVEQVMRGVDGLILGTTRLSDDRISDLSTRKPVVLINREVDGVTGVVPQIEPGATALVSHLHELGHRSIAYLSGPSTSWVSDRRWDVILATAEEHGIAAVEIGPSAPTIEGGLNLLRRVNASRATAAVAYNDLMAVGLLRAATKSGLEVPSQLSIAGFDDIFGDELITPALTTVGAPLVEAGQRAVAHLLAILDDSADVLLDPEPLTTRLVVRASTGTPRKT